MASIPPLMRATARIVALVGCLLQFAAKGDPVVGRPLPAWEPGILDVHQINTGQGDAAFFVFPDGTTLLLDAGARSREGDSGFAAPPRPNGSLRPGQWIVRYIRRMHPDGMKGMLDYAAITHFHGDHMGHIGEGSSMSASGAYRLNGITDVGEEVPIRRMLDRGWPDYDYPVPLADPMVENYKAFLKWQVEHRKMEVERLEAGCDDQIVLQRDRTAYLTFDVRNVAANGCVWTGAENEARDRFTDGVSPTENNCSFAFRLRYGPFSYFNGGDLKGLPSDSISAGQDMESAVAWVVGPVDVYALNHHGSPDSGNRFILSVLQPRVHIASVWAASHPGPDVMRRLVSPDTYPGPRDIFLTNGMWEGRRSEMVKRFGEEDVGWLADQIQAAASSQGHVVVRVAPGGADYTVAVIDDSTENGVVLSVHGPYRSRGTPAQAMR